MARDLIDRKLVYEDYEHLDTSPTSMKSRASWDKAKQINDDKVKRAASLTFLAAQLKVARGAKHEERAQRRGPNTWRTKSRTTTRPNMSGTAVELAERYDGSKQPVMVTEAGAVPVVEASSSQLADKRERMTKAAEEAANLRGKGNVKPMPPDHKGKGTVADPKGKGKAKEVPEDDDFDIYM